MARAWKVEYKGEWSELILKCAGGQLLRMTAEAGGWGAARSVVGSVPVEWVECWLAVAVLDWLGVPEAMRAPDVGSGVEKEGWVRAENGSMVDGSGMDPAGVVGGGAEANGQVGGVVCAAGADEVAAVDSGP